MLQVLASIDTNLTYTCGDIGLSFSGMLPYVISMIILIIKIVVPILLIIFGMIDLAKAVMAQKEDEIKKGQQTFIKRLIAAIIVFFVITIVQMIINFVSNDNDDIGSCFKCFVNGEANACTVDGSKDIDF
jgi:uncharacterized membrane protein YjgN (DUF898 family)